MTGYALAFLAGGLSIWILGLWLGRVDENSRLPDDAAAIVFDAGGTSLRMPTRDGDVPEHELFAVGVFLLIHERDPGLAELVQARVEEIAAEE